MKKMFLAMAVAAGCASPAWALGAEMIRNGTFEGGLQEWRTGLWDGGQYTFSKVQGHGSRGAVLIACKKQGRGGIGQTKVAQLDPGAKYVFSAWVKARNAVGGICFANFYSPKGSWGQVHLPVGNHDWQRVVKVMTAPAHGKLQLYIHNKTAGDVYLDDVSLRKLDPGEAPPSSGRTIVNDYKLLPIGKDYAIGVSSTMEKVFRDETYPHKPTDSAEVSLARGEGEGLQLVVIHPRKKLSGVKVTAGRLVRSGRIVTGAPKVTVSPINYVNVRDNARFYMDRAGWHPVVLLPNAAIDIEKNLSQPFWIDVVADGKTPPGTYKSTITVKPANSSAQKLSLTVRVRKFAIPVKPSIRTITWVPMGGPRKVGGKKIDYVNMALDHRLGPGGTTGTGFSWGPHSWLRSGKGYSFARLPDIHPELEHCLKRGMNTFAMAFTPNLHRNKKDRYEPRLLETLGPFVKAYQQHIQERGYEALPLVYGYDECPRKHWGEHKKAYAALKKDCPEARMILCLNEPEGVKALAGHTDIWLMYIPFHEKSEIEKLKKPGEDIWWSYGCMYPADRPNQFIPYPGIDLRITPWLAWRHNIKGLSNWGLTYWHASNVNAKRTFPTDVWTPNTEVPGDGSLVYPGPGGKPLASARLKNTRDGLEDYEYIVLAGHLAAKGDRKAKAALAEARSIMTSPTVYTQDPKRLLAVRKLLGDAIEAGTK